MLPEGVDNVVELHTDDYTGNEAEEEDEEEEEDAEEAGLVLVLKELGFSSPPRSSRFKGVYKCINTKKWKAEYRGEYLGVHTTEIAAARAFSKYFKDGVIPEPAAAGPVGPSQFKGVNWDKSRRLWSATCKGTFLGGHTTEKGAACAYSKYLANGTDPVEYRGDHTSQVAGVTRDLPPIKKWRRMVNGRYVYYNRKENAELACSVEAERVERALTVIPPAGAAGASAGAGAGVGAGGDAAKPARDADDAAKGGPVRSSQFQGVSWHKGANTWMAACKGTHLGCHATEEDAARAYNTYLMDGINYVAQ
jgi:hypothetical protein